MEYIQETITFKSILKFLLLNESPFNGHLWYLGAILYVLIIYVFADKLHLRKLLYIAAPALLIGDLALGKYSLVLLEREFPYIIVRNFLFVGIPYFTIGCLLKQHENRIKEHVKKGTLIGAGVLFTASTILERYVLVLIDMNSTRDHYISSTLLAVTVFVIAVKRIGLFGRKGRVGGVLSTIGRKYSTWVYIIHPIFVTVLAAIMSMPGGYSVCQFIAPIVVYLMTIATVACAFEIRKRTAGAVRK